MQKIVHGVQDWFECLPFMIKHLYFSFLNMEYYIYMEQEPKYWVLVSPKYIDSLKYDVRYRIRVFDTLAYYGESFFASGDFDHRLDRYKISSHFETIDRTNPLLIKSIEMYNDIYAPRKQNIVTITTLPDNVDWKIYKTIVNGDTCIEVVAQPHMVYDVNGVGYDNGYKRIQPIDIKYLPMSDD